MLSIFSPTIFKTLSTFWARRLSFLEIYISGFMFTPRVFRCMENIAWDGPEWGPRGRCPAHLDLADILGRTYLDFANFHVFAFLDRNFLDFQVPRSLKTWSWPGLGEAGPGLSHLDQKILPSKVISSFS